MVKLRTQRMSTEQLEAKAVGQMINKAICLLNENRLTINHHVFNSHNVKSVKNCIKKINVIE